MRNWYFVFLVLLSGLSFSQTQNDSILVENKLKIAVKNQNDLKYNLSYENFMEALELAKKTKNKALIFKTNLAIANFYIMKGEEKRAADFFRKNFPDENFPIDLKSQYYHRKAFFYDQMIQLDSALIYSQKALGIAKKGNLTSDLALIYNEIGYIYERMNKFALSEEYYNKVFPLVKNDFQVYCQVHYNKARLYANMKKYNESNEMLKENLQLIKNTNWRRHRSYLYEILSKNYRALGDSSNHYKYAYLNREETIAIFEESSENNYNDLLLKYQTKEKDQQINKEKTERRILFYIILGMLALFAVGVLLYFFIRKKNLKLNNLLERNNFLLSELNHRIKNNLQLIVSLTARETNKNDSSEITGLTSLATKIESIASLHKQLYLNDELKLVNIKPYLKEIINNISPFLEHNEIILEEELDDVEIDSNLSLYIGLIVNELIINSIKHAFPNTKSKRIFVRVKNEKKYIEIYYSDNGVGIADDKKAKLITTLSRQVEAQFLIENRNGFYYNAKIKI